MRGQEVEGGHLMKSIIYQGHVLAAPQAKWRIHFSSTPRSTLHTGLTNVLRWRRHMAKIVVGFPGAIAAPVMV